MHAQYSLIKRVEAKAQQGQKGIEEHCEGVQCYPLHDKERDKQPKQRSDFTPKARSKSQEKGGGKAEYHFQYAHQLVRGGRGRPVIQDCFGKVSVKQGAGHHTKRRGMEIDTGAAAHRERSLFCADDEGISSSRVDVAWGRDQVCRRKSRAGLLEDLFGDVVAISYRRVALPKRVVDKAGAGGPCNCQAERVQLGAVVDVISPGIACMSCGNAM